MGKSVYVKLKEMLDELKINRSEISQEELKKIIMMKIGSDMRTLKRASVALTELNLIEEHDGRIIFK